MRVGHALHRDPELGMLCRAPEVIERLRSLFGSRVRYLHSAVTYKQPYSDLVQFGLHQDAAYLPTSPETLTRTFIALDDMDEENGCLEWISEQGIRGSLVSTRAVEA